MSVQVTSSSNDLDSITAVFNPLFHPAQLGELRKAAEDLLSVEQRLLTGELEDEEAADELRTPILERIAQTRDLMLCAPEEAIMRSTGVQELRDGLPFIRTLLTVTASLGIDI